MVRFQSPPGDVRTEYPGTEACSRAIEAIEGKDGILDLAQFLVESFRGLPAKIEASPNSEAEWVELQETRLDILQAMRRIVSLTQVAETEMDIVTGP